MRRILSMVTVLVLCLSMVCPAYAANFVPSIEIKDEPTIVPTDGHYGYISDDDWELISEVEEGCLVITPVSEAETSTKIPEDAREELLEVYEALKDGSMTIPYGDDENWVIRELFDLSWLCEEHPKMMEEGYNLVVTFDIGVPAGAPVNVMVYHDEQWVPALQVKNNGDGTVTVMLDCISPVAISVPGRFNDNDTPPQTGDVAGSNLVLWGVIMVSAAAAFVVLVANRRKFN